MKKDPAKISELLNSSLSHLGITARLKEYALKKIWAEVVGPALVVKACAHNLIGTVLYCNVCSTAWLTEFTYQKPVLIAKLNEKLGRGTVTEIIFKLGKVSLFEFKPEPIAPVKHALTEEEKRTIDDTVKTIKDETLKEAVKKAMTTSKT